MVDFISLRDIHIDKYRLYQRFGLNFTSAFICKHMLIIEMSLTLCMQDIEKIITGPAYKLIVLTVISDVLHVLHFT